MRGIFSSTGPEIGFPRPILPAAGGVMLLLLTPFHLQGMISSVLMEPNLSLRALLIPQKEKGQFSLFSKR